MKNLITAFIITLSFGALAQPGDEFFPDFTEVDIDGVEHSLYADYLDQGKTVVIDIFATWCPLCTNSLPSLHELSDTYGDDIVLLSFERDENTSNEAEWAENWGVTDPIFANSFEVMASWNTVYQPNYFVICPDGSFELKVGAIGMSPTILNDYVDGCLADDTNSIEETSKIEFSISPNPVYTELSFTSNLLIGKYTVVNLAGKLELKGDFENDTNTLDVSNLETGLYFLKVEAGNSFSVRKFIKN